MTNAFIVLAPANMLNPDGKPSAPLPKFSKHLHGTESSDEQGSEGLTLRLGLHQQVLGWGDAVGRLCWRVQTLSSRRSSGGCSVLLHSLFWSPLHCQTSPKCYY